MHTLTEHSDYDVIGRVVFDPEPTNPLEDWDHAWTLIGDSRCPFTLDERGGGVHFGFGCDFRGAEDIQAERRSGDTVALLRVLDFNANGGKIQRVNSLDQCNAIARIERETIANEWGGDRAAAFRYLDGILETLNSYFAGEVYGFVVDAANEPHIDSCWGYVGDESYVEDEMRAAVSCLAASRRNESLTRGLATCAPYALAL